MFTGINPSQGTYLYPNTYPPPPNMQYQYYQQPPEQPPSNLQWTHSQAVPAPYIPQPQPHPALNPVSITPPSQWSPPGAPPPAFDPDILVAGSDSTAVLSVFGQLQDRIRQQEADRSALMRQHDGLEQRVLLFREQSGRRKAMEVAHATELMHGLESEKRRVAELEQLKAHERSSADTRLGALERDKNDLVDSVVNVARHCSALESSLSEENTRYSTANSERMILAQQLEESERRLANDRAEAARKIQLLEDKHLELSRLQTIAEMENEKLHNQLNEEQAMRETEQANETKAGALLNNVLRLNEKLVLQLQAIGKSRKGPWKPSSVSPHEMAQASPPRPGTASSSSRQAAPSPYVKRSTNRRSVSASRKRSSLKASTAASVERKRASLPRSHAQVRSIMQREAAAEQRAVDHLEADFHRLDKEFRNLVNTSMSYDQPPGTVGRKSSEQLLKNLDLENSELMDAGSRENDAWLQTVLDSMIE